MPLIGVRELREHTAEVLRQVREDKKEYVITYQGRPVALLMPVDTEAVESKILEASKQSTTDPWKIYEQLAESIRQTWPGGLSTQAIIDEVRRE